MVRSFECLARTLTPRERQPPPRWKAGIVASCDAAGGASVTRPVPEEIAFAPVRAETHASPGDGRWLAPYSPGSSPHRGATRARRILHIKASDGQYPCGVGVRPLDQLTTDLWTDVTTAAPWTRRHDVRPVTPTAHTPPVQRSPVRQQKKRGWGRPAQRSSDDEVSSPLWPSELSPSLPSIGFLMTRFCTIGAGALVGPGGDIGPRA